MKFPRSARIFRGHLDVAPFAAVFFLLLLFAVIGTLIYTPGVQVDLPRADDLAGTDRPTVAVAVDAAGRVYFENQPVDETVLREDLKQAASKSPEPLTLLVQADKAVAYEHLIRLTLLARDAGITNSLFAVLPRVYAAPAAQTAPQP
ncbi:MAG: biopolymer transporter ExbD [Verrucomicrobiota bacterium]